MASTGLTGLLGGTFDPPQNGHIALAEAAIIHFQLDRLIVLVTGEAPHKDVDTDAEMRYRLANTAFERMPRVELSRHELERPGPSYTVDTARWARDEFGSAIFLVGADEFVDFLKWKDPDEILRHVRLGVATRPGYVRDQLDSVLSSLERPDSVEFFEIPSVPVSSTSVREQVRRGEDIEDLVPIAVARLIEELGLYR